MCVIMSVKMFFFVVLVRFSSSSCVYVENVGVLDCSILGLTDLEPIYAGLFNLFEVKSLYLPDNLITRGNFSLLIRRLPHVQLLDLQGNPFNCDKTALVEVLSDCNYSSCPTSSMFGLTSTNFATNLSSISIIASITTVSSTPHIKQERKSIRNHTGFPYTVLCYFTYFGIGRDEN